MLEISKKFFWPCIFFAYFSLVNIIHVRWFIRSAGEEEHFFAAFTIFEKDQSNVEKVSVVNCTRRNEKFFMDDSGKLQAYANKTVKNNNVYVKAFKGERGWSNKDSYSEYMSHFGKIWKKVLDIPQKGRHTG